MNQPFKETRGSEILKKINALPIRSTFRILNVCGGHERTITMSGLRKILPKTIELIPGPGCPVCVCPEEDIYLAIQLALNEDITLLAFGDMLRVPVNVKKHQCKTLTQAKSAGANIQAIASPLDALKIAEQNPQKKHVFFSTGFETTTAPVAAMLKQGIPENLSILLSGRRTWPAVEALLNEDQNAYDGLIAPGHVATVMGAEEWQFVVTNYKHPTAVAGFTAESLLTALYSLLRQHIENQCFLDNCYPDVVKPDGNNVARTCLNEVMDIVDANWRGIGIIRESGFQLNETYQHYDARMQFDWINRNNRQTMDMPHGCDCAKVLLGKIYPNQCRLYDTACKPQSPIGPCMVSDEGACHIWWQGGIDRTDEAV